MDEAQIEVPGVNIHHSIIFLAREKAVKHEEEAKVEEADVERGLEGFLDALKGLRSETGGGDQDPRQAQTTLDSRLELRTEPRPPSPYKLWRKDPYDGLRELSLPGICPPPVKVVKQYDLSEDDFSTESDEPKRKSWKTPMRLRHPDVNMYSKDYWLARKKVKTLRVGNDLAVINTLNLMKQMDLTQQDILYGIVDSGGLETILNILDYKGVNPKVNALKLLNKMADHEIAKGIMINQGIADSCFRLLSHASLDIVLECSRILLKLCALTCMRAYCRKSRGLEILLEFADMKDEKWLKSKKPQKLTDQEKSMCEVGVNCLKALDLLYGSRQVRRKLYKLGFLGLLKKLIHSKNPEFYEIGIRMITRSASINEYTEVFIEEGLMEFVYKKYITNATGIHLDMLRIIYKCLSNVRCKHWMLERGFYEFLMEEFNKRATKELKYTMACIVKLVNNRKYRKIFDNNNPIQKLFILFDHPSPKIREYAGYLMGQLSRFPKNFSEIAGNQNYGILKLLEYVQTKTDYTLVAHIYKVICDLSYDDRIYWDICDVTDPIGILWNAVTADHPQIHEYGCSALVPYLGPMPDSIERVLGFPGALHDVLALTTHPDDGAKAGAVTLLARLCQCGQLFLPLIEEGFDERLLELAKTATHPRLRYAIGYGLGSCARTEAMSFSLGKRGAVAILLDWLLNDKDKYAQLGIVTGLWKLSYEPINCKAIIQANVVERLTYLSVGRNECLQNSLAGLLGNMRYLARSAECVRNKQRPHPPERGIGRASDPDIIHPFQYADDPDDTPV